MASGNACIGKPALEFQAPPVVDGAFTKEDEGIAYRGLFIIDGKGDPQITRSDLPVGYSVNEALRLVQALQFTGEHEEVCPAGWVPGSHAVKPSVNHNNGIFL
ncbi:hypothetical protein JEQ12_003373 [Ovis aries]|uniref:thioredoxin-dependent peroxiredoxin n=1 Tax=Ovis aries TaxID=9940 RepID=A0A835ZXH4_SHEEP|nr:hypothetical protein JEQ12_003373 [Ovis aries]